MRSTARSHDTNLGTRLRQVRTARGLSVRELARRAGCSASLVSQVERGIVTPSAGVVYALANELEISLDLLFGPDDELDLPDAAGGGRLPPSAPEAHGWVEQDGATPPRPTHPRRSWGRATGADGEGILQRAAERSTIELSTGIRWERLTPDHDRRVDFLEVVYEPHGQSSDNHRAVRHDGREYLLVLEGQIDAVIGFETLRLHEGDSLAFDPNTPHQYSNPSETGARCLSIIVHDVAD